MTYKLGRIMGHIGHAPPESNPFESLHILGIDVPLAKKALQKLYFKPIPVVDKFGSIIESYETYHDVYFVPNDTKHGSLFALKYGLLKNETKK